MPITTTMGVFELVEKGDSKSVFRSADGATTLEKSSTVKNGERRTLVKITITFGWTGGDNVEHRETRTFHFVDAHKEPTETNHETAIYDESLVLSAIGAVTAVVALGLNGSGGILRLGNMQREAAGLAPSEGNYSNGVTFAASAT